MSTISDRSPLHATPRAASRSTYGSALPARITPSVSSQTYFACRRTSSGKSTYRMAAVNAGFKYRGFSLDGEYYWRTLDDFRATGPLPRDSFEDDEK